MLKRKLLEKRSYHDSEGKEIIVYLYQKAVDRGMNARVNHGMIEMYISSRTTDDKIDRFAKLIIQKYQHKVFLNRPFYEEGRYLFVLGEKKYLTCNMGYSYDPRYFYFSFGDEPLDTFIQNATEYIRNRSLEIGKAMGRDLSDWEIELGVYQSYYGCCFPRKKKLEFDYRVYAYRKDIIDQLITHEIAHSYQANHSQKFYNIVKSYCPNYKKLDSYLKKGMFQGEEDLCLLKSSKAKTIQRTSLF